MYVNDLLRSFPYTAPAIAILACLLVGLVIQSRRASFPTRAPKLISDNLPFVGTLQFWTHRGGFFRHNGAESATGNFSYYIGKHRVVGLTGDAGRKVFLESRELDFTEGYGVLFGQSPDSVQTASEQRTSANGFPQLFAKRLGHLIRTEKLVQALPVLMIDTRDRLDELAADPHGITDPFKSVYDIVFLLTMRMVGCNEITSDRALLEEVLQLYETVEKSATATTIVFPWMPTPALIKRIYAGGRLYMKLRRIIADREKTGRREEDALQYLLDLGDELKDIITFVVGALFAGQVNSGINAAYLLVYLASSPEWMGKVREELQSVARKYATDDKLPLTEQLMKIPLEAWESEFKILHICFLESIRIQTVGALFRRNASAKDVKVGDEVIPAGAFATYHLSDIHMDPEVYPDPDTWDPSRHLAGATTRTDRPYPYIGWGAARHPCLGMRFAKLEQYIITAFFLAYFDFSVCDSEGRQMAQPPPVQANNYNPTRPNPLVCLKYSLRR